MISRTLTTTATRARIPLIKFRKGGDGGSQTPPGQHKAGGTYGVNSGPAIEDWELAPRFWRKPIDVDEINYINTGGPILQK